jgi:biopolymer transport protein TolQ
MIRSYRLLFLMPLLLVSGVIWAQKTNVAVETGFWHAIVAGGPVGQSVLLLLVGMSVMSWAIMIKKQKHFDITGEADVGFMEIFAKAKSLEDIFKLVEKHPNSTIAQVYKAGYLELQKMADSALASESKSKPLLSGIDNLERSLRKAIDLQIANLDYRLSFLATTGSTGPFIGLFGTVWGIMRSFAKIGATGSASLAVVAPGLSEALIATAIGLVAAIPATVGYNHFATRLKKRELELNNFAADFLNIAKRNFFKQD